MINTIEDLRLLAKKRVPRMFYDYADSGSWTESTYRANESDFSDLHFRQRVAVNLENRTLQTTMVGQTVSMPVALVGAVAGAVIWPKIGAKVTGAAKKAG